MKNDCLHCPGSYALSHPLFDDDKFWIICDIHPITEGHILIIPKDHISCMGALDDETFERYKELYSRVKGFVKKEYGSVAIFEHGIIGQTVFHAHTHFFPFKGKTNEIIEDSSILRKIESLDSVKTEFISAGKYLFFENNDEMFLVDTIVGYPRFFRDIFAKLLGAESRGNWKTTEKSEELMKTFDKEISSLEKKWKR